MCFSSVVVALADGREGVVDRDSILFSALSSVLVFTVDAVEKLEEVVFEPMLSVIIALRGNCKVEPVLSC